MDLMNGEYKQELKIVVEIDSQGIGIY